MKSIENIANNFLKVYAQNDKREIAQKAESLIKEINKNEQQLKNIEHFYIVAKAFYYLVEQEEYDLSNNEYYTIIRLMYYCLLKHYLTNRDINSTELKYLDVIAGSELAFIVICENIEYLLYTLLTGELNYVPNYSKKYLKDQLMLFGGIVKDSKLKHHHYFTENDLSKKFVAMSEEFYNNLPTKDNLQGFKTGCASVLEKISKNLEDNFRDCYL